jgi:hypothetical protein
LKERVRSLTTYVQLENTQFDNIQFDNKQIENKLFKNKQFENKQFENKQFENKQFENRQFDNTQFNSLQFENGKYFKFGRGKGRQTQTLNCTRHPTTGIIGQDYICYIYIPRLTGKLWQPLSSEYCLPTYTGAKTT